MLDRFHLPSLSGAAQPLYQSNYNTELRTATAGFTSTIVQKKGLRDGRGASQLLMCSSDASLNASFCCEVITHSLDYSFSLSRN